MKRGWHHTEKARDKMRKNHNSADFRGEKNPFYGKHHSKKTKEKLKEISKGKHYTPEREFKKGNIPWNTGKHWSKKIKTKMSKSHKGMPSCKPMLGKYHSEKTKEKMSKSRSGKNNIWYKKGYRFEGKKNPNWRGGISKLPYKFDFDGELKELIRKRDGYICQFPRCVAKQNGRLHCIHHIDYNKQNSNPLNLITLCNKHNGIVNSNRQYWENYFNDALAKKKLY